MAVVGFTGNANEAGTQITLYYGSTPAPATIQVASWGRTVPNLGTFTKVSGTNSVALWAKTDNASGGNSMVSVKMVAFRIA